MFFSRRKPLPPEGRLVVASVICACGAIVYIIGSAMPSLPFLRPEVPLPPGSAITIVDHSLDVERSFDVDNFDEDSSDVPSFEGLEEFLKKPWSQQRTSYVLEILNNQYLMMVFSLRILTMCLLMFTVYEFLEAVQVTYPGYRRCVGLYSGTVAAMTEIVFWWSFRFSHRDLLFSELIMTSICTAAVCVCLTGGVYFYLYCPVYFPPPQQGHFHGNEGHSPDNEAETKPRDDVRALEGGNREEEGHELDDEGRDLGEEGQEDEGDGQNPGDHEPAGGYRLRKRRS